MTGSYAVAQIDECPDIKFRAITLSWSLALDDQERVSKKLPESGRSIPCMGQVTRGQRRTACAPSATCKLDTAPRIAITHMRDGLRTIEYASKQ
jgi:hypothetical protein